MEALCPDCNDELTPSIVGYLCHNCGSVHQFDKVSKQSTSHKTNKHDATETSTKMSQKSSQKVSEPSVTKEYKSQSRLKRFLVPRISSKNATSLNPKK